MTKGVMRKYWQAAKLALSNSSKNSACTDNTDFWWADVHFYQIPKSYKLLTASAIK